MPAVTSVICNELLQSSSFLIRSVSFEINGNDDESRCMIVHENEVIFIMNTSVL